MLTLKIRTSFSSGFFVGGGGYLLWIMDTYLFSDFSKVYLKTIFLLHVISEVSITLACGQPVV